MQRTDIGGEMFAEYIDWRAEHPSDDLMTELLQAEFEDETGTVRRLTREEVLTYVNEVAGAGNETTNRLIEVHGQTVPEGAASRRPGRASASSPRAQGVATFVATAGC